jgi:hypothetical protein
VVGSVALPLQLKDLKSATMQAVGPWVAERAIGITPLIYVPVPYEEMRLKKP